MINNVFQFDWEVKLMVWLQTYIFNNPVTINLCIFLTLFGEAFMSVLIIGAVYFGIDKKFGKYVGLNVMSSVVMNPLIKNLFFRLRPYFVNESIKCLKLIDESADAYDLLAQGYSFPSGHTMAATSSFASLATRATKKVFKIICVAMPILVGISRFALGCHYPTDVIVGAIASLIIFFVYNKLLNKFSMNIVMIAGAIVFAAGFFYCKTNDYYQLYGLYLGLVLACLFEERFVNFKNTKNIVKIIIRTILGGLVFLAFEKGFKYLLAIIFVYDSELLNNLLILARYLISCFITLGVYPIIFKYNILKLKDDK